MTVTFCGNRFVYSDIKEALNDTVEKLIKEGADEFLLGGYGEFDKLAAITVKNMKKKYAHIRSVIVIPYLNKYYNNDLYEVSLYPELENVHPKGAIIKRNQYMVDASDVVVAYVKYKNGGAAKTLKYAEKKNKRIIDICP